MTDSLNNLLSQIRTLHAARRRSDLKYDFDLGDLILSAVCRSELCVYDVIKRIRADLGADAYGETTYQRMARIAQIFTQRQRQTLIDKAVPIGVVDILASKQYDGERRHRTVTAIKVGRCVSPWKSIRRFAPVEIAEPRLKGRDNGSEYPALNVMPPFDQDKVVNIAKSILSHIKTGRSLMTVGDFDQAINTAKKELGMS